MKLTKMSLVAGLLLGANMYAIDNVKVNGSASLFYLTNDVSQAGTANGNLFDKSTATGDVGLNLGLTADLTENVSTGVSVQAVSSLGLENNLVSGVWSGAHSTSTSTGASFGPNSQVNDAAFVSEAWIAGTAGKTTAKVGRQAVDTPLAFTETWNITTNTFEGAVLINEDLPDTTIVAAWLGKSNGMGDDQNKSGVGDVTAKNGAFSTFATNGAYAIGAINNSFKPVTAQAWFYAVQQLADAYWLQVDFAQDGILAGAQYTNIDPSAAGSKDDTAYGLMLGYEMPEVGTLKVAYSSVDDEGTFGVANLATRGQTAGAASKLYTEMWWWYGTVSATGADTYAISAETTVGDGYDLFLGYYSCDTKVQGGTKTEVDELAFTVSKSFGPLDTSVAVIYDDFDQEATKSATYTEYQTSLQVYLTYNF